MIIRIANSSRISPLPIAGGIGIIDLKKEAS